jgi:restriction endonuclease S subunit
MYSKRAMWTYIKYTTGIQNLDLTSLLSNEKIPLPPIDEQRAIVAYINEKTAKVESLITDLQAEIEHLKEYKQRLIADCVTGKVNVQNKL